MTFGSIQGSDKGHAVGMDNYWVRPTTVQRTIFLDGQALCRKCKAHVRPSKAESAFVRLSGASTAIAWCSVCTTTTNFDLEPRREA